MKSQNRLEWVDLEPVARQVFRIWMDGTELQWAKRAWTILEKGRLNVYTDPASKCQCSLRFLALCDIYLDFAKVAWDEEYESNYLDWMDTLGEPDTVLGYLLNRIGNIDGVDIDDRYSVIQSLARSTRKEVFACLRDGFGGAPKFFEDLWLTRHNKRKAEEERDLVFHEIRGEKMAAWSWVEDGCEPYRGS